MMALDRGTAKKDRPELIRTAIGIVARPQAMSVKEPLINLRIMAHCGFDSRATVWTGS